MTTYTCGICSGIFDSTISMDESNRQSLETWGVPATHPDMVVVCDFCYQLISPELYPEEYEATLVELRGGRYAN